MPACLPAEGMSLTARHRLLFADVAGLLPLSGMRFRLVTYFYTVANNGAVLAAKQISRANHISAGRLCL